MTSVLEQKFWQRVMKDDKTGCWNWIGHHNGHGYCPITVQAERTYVHRVAYEMFVGPIPDGLEIDHLCRNRKCVNPKHLEAVTTKVNSLRSNSPQAINAKKTHCPNGHPLEGDNLDNWNLAHGVRVCKICHIQEMKWVSEKRKALRHFNRMERVSRPKLCSKCNVVLNQDNWPDYIRRDRRKTCRKCHNLNQLRMKIKRSQ